MKQLIEDLISAMEYHVEQTRPIHSTTVALQAAREALKSLSIQDALDKMAENARELGLDYEPAGGTQVSKVWWDGEKLMAKTIPLEDFYQPVQEPLAWLYPEGLEALKAGKCWTAYGTKQDDNCNTPLYLNTAVATKVEPAKADCDEFDSYPAAPAQEKNA